MTLEGSIKTLVSTLPHRAVQFARRTSDSWINTLTGLGSNMVDKVKFTVPGMFGGGLHDQVLSDLFHGDAMARKIVTKKPDDALRLGVRVHVPDEAGGHETSTAIQDHLDDLDIVGNFRKAGYWENLYGGSVLFIALDDGQYAVDSQAQPVRLDAIRKIHWVCPIDRTRIHASTLQADIDSDETSPTFGQPLIFLVDIAMTGVQARVHRSRLIIFPGAITTDYERRARGGWGVSVLDPIYEALQRNASAWQSAGNALANSQYVIYKLKNLASMFTRPNGEEQARSRARAMEMAKSLINAVLIDADDDYVRENPDFGNMPQMLNELQLDLSGQADTPATVLYGRSPAGMNATGESDIELWHGSLVAYQEHHLRPRLHSFITMLMLSKEGPTKGKLADGWRVYFPALRQLSELEKAELRAKTSAADDLDIKNGILLPQEVAVSRFRPEGYSIETQVDVQLRTKLLALEIEARETEMREGRAPGMTPPEPTPEPDNDNGVPKKSEAAA